MTFQSAITILAQGRGIAPTPEWDTTIDEARRVVTDAVTDLLGDKAEYGDVYDWIASGDFSENETAENIAAEWSA